MSRTIGNYLVLTDFQQEGALGQVAFVQARSLVPGSLDDIPDLDLDGLVVALRTVGLELLAGLTHDQLMHVRARLDVYDTEHGQGELHSNTFYPFDPQGSLTPDTIAILLEKLHESNRDLNMNQLEFTLIFDPRTYNFAGAGNREASKWYADTYKEHRDRFGTLSCMAYALARQMIQTSRMVSTIEEAEELAREIMFTCNWSQYTNTDALNVFVRHYTEYRVAVFRRGIHFAMEAIAGSDWVPPIRTRMVHKDRKTLYLEYHPETDDLPAHFSACRTPTFTAKGVLFCHRCLTGHFRNTLCRCPRTPEEVNAFNSKVKSYRIKSKKPCTGCKQYGCTSQTCQTSCRYCRFPGKRTETDDHRCILSAPRPFHEFWTPQKTHDDHGKLLPRLWAYDIETSMERHPTRMTVDIDFDHINVDWLINSKGKINITKVNRNEHVFCLLVVKSVFEDTPTRSFWGLDEFIDFATSENQGHNVFFAHNAAGYDNRVLMNYFRKKGLLLKNIVRQGSKITEFSLQNAVFRDSLKHLPGRLASLTKEFLPGRDLEKGIFPHLFNTRDNFHYIGAIPGIEFFDLAHMRTKEEIEQFKEWHGSWKGKIWNFRSVLEEYCKLDVIILAEIMKVVHQEFLPLGGSPWCRTTMPSFIHDLHLKTIYDSMDGIPENPEERREVLQRLAHESFWPVLTHGEYWFVRRCLRGGRTECRRTLFEVQPESGDKIEFADVTSMYPFVQIANDYPVGTPIVHVYDKDYYPCKACEAPPLKNNPNCHDMKCMCPFVRKEKNKDKRMDIRIEHEQPTREQILSDEFFGFVCATVILPPTDFVPSLIHYSYADGKCIAANGILREEYFCSEELKLAVELGARVLKIHRFDRYRRKKGLWNPLIKQLYMMKLKNSGPKPDHWREYAAKYHHLGMEEMVLESLQTEEWGDNPARKLVAKIALNCGWGKHAQRPLMEQTIVFPSSDVETLKSILDNDDKKIARARHLDIQPGSHVYTAYVQPSGHASGKQFHHLFLPAACMVPSYGRIMFLKKVQGLNDPERQLLMHDTDSIMYVKSLGDRSLIEGDIFGQWAEEKVSKIGITGFIGMGPKSYALKLVNGSEKIKQKGVSYAYSHRNLINYQVLKEAVLNPHKVIEVPQQSFVGQDEITTHRFLKKVQFNCRELKGELRRKNGVQGHVLYPRINR